MGIIFVNGYNLTDEGSKAIAFMEAQIDASEASGGDMNTLPGYVKQYWALKRTSTITPVQYLTDFPNAGNAALADIEYLNSKKQTANALESNKQDIEQHGEVLNKLQEQLSTLTEALKTEMATIRSEMETLKKPAEASEKKDQ